MICFRTCFTASKKYDNFSNQKLSLECGWKMIFGKAASLIIIGDFDISFSLNRMC